jgi:hypothetical protein
VTVDPRVVNVVNVVLSDALAVALSELVEVPRACVVVANL